MKKPLREAETTKDLHWLDRRKYNKERQKVLSLWWDTIPKTDEFFEIEVRQSWWGRQKKIYRCRIQRPDWQVEGNPKKFYEAYDKYFTDGLTAKVHYGTTITKQGYLTLITTGYNDGRGFQPWFVRNFPELWEGKLP